MVYYVRVAIIILLLSSLCSSILEHKQASLDALHDYGATLEVWVVGPGTTETRAVALWGYVEESHLLEFGILVLNVGDVQDAKTSTVVSLICQVAPAVIVTG